MLDGEIRSALRTSLDLVHTCDSSTLILDELGLCGRVRVDVAVINGSISGYELKSDRDTLRRLPTQVEVYSQVLDFATLVVGENHFSSGHAVDLLPSWWGIIVATESSVGDAELHQWRVGQRNPSVDSMALVQLLWREEALTVLAEIGKDRGVRSKPRWVIAERLAQETTVAELGNIVRCSLKSREGWRSLPQRG